MTAFPSVPESLINAIKNCKRAVVCGHQNPDGDCANSVMALGLLLKSLNKPYILVNEGNFNRPEIQEFGKIVSEDVPKSWLNNETLGIIADCSVLDRIGKFQDIYQYFDILVVDHHSSGTEFGHYRYIVPESISTTLLVYQLYKACNIELTEESARMIFRGFATDSGFFKFLKADCSPTFEIIADLVKHNVAPDEEFYAVNGNKQFESVKFLSELIKRTESFFDGRLMISHEKLEDSNTFGDNARASDDLYAQLLAVKGVEAVLFFKKSKKVEHAIEVGFRASYFSKIDVGAIASSFGGGGHAKASGCTIKGSYAKVKEQVINAIRPYFD